MNVSSISYPLLFLKRYKPQCEVISRKYNNFSEIPNTSVASLYLKKDIAKPFGIKNIIEILENCGYRELNGIYSKKLTEEEKDNLIFMFYPENKEQIDTIPHAKRQFEMFKRICKPGIFPLSTTIEKVIGKDIDNSDILDLVDFANLGDGKIGKHIKENPEFGILIFKLLKHNDLYSSFMKQAKTKPEILNMALQLFENKPTIEEIRVLNDYKSQNSFKINKHLRELNSGKINSLPPEDKLAVDKMDSYIEKNKIKMPISVSRGDHMAIIKSLDSEDYKRLDNCIERVKTAKDEEVIRQICDEISKKGLEFQYPNYLSTSIDSPFKRDIEWEITTTEGTCGIYLDLLNLISQNTAKENEVLFERNSKLKITGLDYDKEKGQIKIKADIYPQTGK